MGLQHKSFNVKQLYFDPRIPQNLVTLGKTTKGDIELVERVPLTRKLIGLKSVWTCELHDFSVNFIG